MSIQDDLRREGLKLTPELARDIKKAVASHKARREKILKAMFKLMKTRRNAKGRLINKDDRKAYKVLKMQYAEEDKRVYRLGGRKKELPYEEFS